MNTPVIESITHDDIVTDFGIYPDHVGIPLYGVQIIDHSPVLIYRMSDVVKWLRENDSSMTHD